MQWMTELMRHPKACAWAKGGGSSEIAPFKVRIGAGGRGGQNQKLPSSKGPDGGGQKERL